MAFDLFMTPETLLRLLITCFDKLYAVAEIETRDEDT